MFGIGFISKLKFKSTLMPGRNLGMLFFLFLSSQLFAAPHYPVFSSSQIKEVASVATSQDLPKEKGLAQIVREDLSYLKVWDLGESETDDDDTTDHFNFSSEEYIISSSLHNIPASGLGYTPINRKLFMLYHSWKIGFLI